MSPSETQATVVAPSLLVAVGATPSLSVARVATAIACSTKAKVQVITVAAGAAEHPANGGDSLWATTSAESRRRAVVRALAGMCPAAARWPVMVRSGEVVATLTETVNAMAVDLLVVGLPVRHRDSGLRDNIVQRSLRGVRVPVLGIAADGVRQPQTVLAAIDFSEASIHAATCALRLMAPGGTLYLAHVGPAFCGDERHRQEMGDEYTRAIADAFARLQRALDPVRGIAIERMPLKGTPLAQLLAFASEIDADLVSVGSHRLEQMIGIGRIPVAFLRDTRRSVLVAPPVQASPPLRSPVTLRPVVTVSKVTAQ